jgi:hypothetical protein
MPERKINDDVRIVAFLSPLYHPINQPSFTFMMDVRLIASSSHGTRKVSSDPSVYYRQRRSTGVVALPRMEFFFLNTFQNRKALELQHSSLAIHLDLNVSTERERFI